jgi:protein SCO1/2
MGSYDRPAPGWHFLVDKDDNAKKLAEQIGFHYRFDPLQQQYAHPAALFVLTPEGKIARYLYGTRFRQMDVRFALAEASQGRTTMTLEKILLFCYQYDPQKHAYVVFAANIMRIGGALTVLIIAFCLWRLFRAERKRSRLWNEGLGKEGLA